LPHQASDYSYDYGNYNNYTAQGSLVLSGTKTVNGKPTDHAFKFALYKVTKDSNGKEHEEKLDETSSVNGVYTFKPLTYRLSDDGPYTYRVKEIDVPAVYKDQTSHLDLNVEVKDDGAGHLYVIDQAGNTLTKDKDGNYTDSFGEYQNSYAANGSLVLSGTKTVNGKPTDHAFKFALYKVTKDSDGTEHEEKLDEVSSKNGAYAFTALSYKLKDVGPYTYRVREVDVPAGYEDQTNHQDLTVEVKDDGAGHLYVTDQNGNTLTQDGSGSYTAGFGVYQNSYSASGSLVLSGTKTVNGGKPKAGTTFTFDLNEVKTVNGQQTRIPVGGEATSDANGNFSFGKITYNLNADTDDTTDIHTYELTETSHYPGYTDQTQKKTLKFKVIDNKDGTLTVQRWKDGSTTEIDRDQKTGTYEDSFGEYNNAYAASGSLVLSGTKTVNGTPKQGFTFALTEVKKANGKDGKETSRSLNPVTSGADGTFQFDKITYDLSGVGEYTYELTETGNYPGYTDTTHQKKLNVKVEDNGDGTLKVSRKDGDQWTVLNGTDNNYTYDFGKYENIYAANGSLVLSGTKTVNEGKPKAGTTFTFDLTEVKTVNGQETRTSLGQAESDKDGNFSFKKITYNLNAEVNDTGIHTYELTETGQYSGYTDQTKKKILHFKVTDKGNGTLTVQRWNDGATTGIDQDKKTGTYEDSFGNYNNVYNAEGKLVLSGTKQVNEQPTDHVFRFALYKVTKDSDGIEHEDKLDEVSSKNGAYAFTALSYQLRDVGTYTYRVREVDVPAGYEDQTNHQDLTVEVKDDGAGHLYVTDQNGNTLTQDGSGSYTAGFGVYQNSYAASGSLVLSGTKTVNDQKPNTDKTFTFDLTEVKTVDGQETRTSVGTATSGADGTFHFDPINYQLSDVGDHTYELTETSQYQGYTNKTQKKTLTVSVTDNGDGTLKVSRKTDDNKTEELKGSGNAYTYDFGKYENTYAASGSLVLSGTKTVNGTPKQGFKFALTEVKKANGKETSRSLNPATSGADGKFYFDKITYSLDDVGEYTYILTESGDYPGYTDTTHQKKLNVKVEDNGDGTLKVSRKDGDQWTVLDGTGNAYTYDFGTYENAYAASGSLKLSGKKVVEGRALDKDFKFQLTEVDEDGTPIAGKQPLTATAYHTKDGAFEFPAINYHKDAQRDDTGLHYYELTETSQYPGYTDLTQKKTLTVSVTDNGDGTLKVSRVDGSNIENLKGSGNAYTYDFGTYKNSYTAKPAALILSGNKTLTGADLSQYAGLFRFDLQDASKKTIDTAKNDTAGRFTFAPLVFDKAGDYTYTISEINGGKTIDGIAYDNSVYTVKVTVTDNNEGQLVASTSIAKDGKKVDDENQAISFTNKKLTEVTVNKNWNDSSNQEGLRPDSITLELLKNGQVVGTTKLSGTGDNWSYTFRDLEPANYTVHESSDSPYYEVDHNDLTADTTKGDQAVTLTNTFGRKIDLTAYKDLTGAKLLDGEFHFRLHRNSDADSSKDIEAVNNADGTINFTDVDYDAKGYTVYELRDSSMTDISFDENNSVDPANTNPIDYTKTGIQFHADGTPADDNNYTIRNEYRPIVLRVQKRSKSAPYDPLVNAVYGLYQVNANGNDILVESELSDANGYMYYGRIEPNTVYYFKEISAPEGHEVDPYPGQHFMVKYVGNGQIAVYDETGTQKLDYGDITESPEEKDKPYRTIQVNTEKTDLDSITVSENEEKYTYSGDGVKAVATAAKGVLPEGTRLAVKKVDPKTQTASYQSPTGIKTQSLETMLENNVGDFTGLAYYDISFMNGDEEVEPTGDVHVTLEPDQALDLQGADPSDLKIVHIVESGEPEDLTRTVSLVTGSVASDGKSVLQTSLTSDSFSVYALVDPKDSTLNGNYMLTAAGVGDFPAKLRVAKVDSSGNFIPNATLCVYKFDATKKDGLGEKVLEWTSAEGVQDWQRKVDVETPYVLVETNAPKGYKIADNIYFSIGKYNSALTCYAYDEKTGKLTESQELTQKCTNGSELIMVDDPIMVTTNYKTKVIPNHKSRTEDKVLYVPGSPKTGEFTASMPWALPLASAAVVLLILTGYLLGKKKRSRK
jgi:pilin isopeptide linkage protein